MTDNPQVKKIGDYFGGRIPETGITIEGPDSGEARFELPGGKIITIKPGQQITITREDLGGHTWLNIEKMK